MDTYYQRYGPSIYDFILTFHAELEYGWKGDITQGSDKSGDDHFVEQLTTYVLTTDICLTAYFSPAWTDICKRFSVVELLHVFIILTLAEMLLCVRTRGMVAQTSVMLNKASETAFDICSFQICVFIPTSNVTRLILAYLALALTFEIFAIIAIFYFTGSTCDRILPLSPWIRVVRKGGMIYFVIKFISTLILIVIILKAPDTLKLITIMPHST
ncbi:hypothetical protein BDQ17DRAFT_1323254 [Cyathus striatus]|nr:hypothetical protein BDQ17DRAFT_1323254 [Cyathus striatus]